MGFEQRVAIIGAGIQGERHAKAWSKLPGVEVGVFDTQQDKALKLQAKYGVNVFPTQDAAIDWSTLVTVATPDHLHTDPAASALRHGRRVFSEKPVTTNLLEAIHLQILAEENGVDFWVAHNLRFVGTFTRVREQMRTGALGRVLNFTASYCHDVSEHHQKTPWRKDHEDLLWSGGTHLVDLAIWMIGEKVEAVYATTGSKSIKDYNHPENYKLLLRFQSGLLADLTISGNIPMPRYGVGLKVAGDRMSYSTDDEEGFKFSQPWKKEQHPKDRTLEMYENHFTIPEEVQVLNDYLSGGRTLFAPIPTLRETLDVMRVLDAAQRSIEQRREIPLNNPN